MPLVQFQIHYKTQFGQSIALVPEYETPVRLEYGEGGTWRGTRAIEADAFRYQYVLLDDEGSVLDRESNGLRELDLQNAPDRVVVRDAWRANGHADNPLYSSPFTRVIFRPGDHKTEKSKPEEGTTIRFRPRILRVQSHERVCVTGNVEALGNWNRDRVVLLDAERFPVWSTDVTIKAQRDVEYKYGILDTRSGEVRLEAGENRRLDTDLFFYDRATVVLHDEYFRYQKSNWRGTGVAMPVFSIRTKNGFGTGEFTDIPALVDWAESVGMNLVQILPVNDTTAKKTWVDSYPYAAISVFALHPLYLNVADLPGFKKHVDQRAYRKLQQQLNAADTVDYEAVMENKLRLARQIFDATRTVFPKEKGYQQFFVENEDWLVDYAVFSYLRELNDDYNFNTWKTGSKRSDALVKKLTKARSKSLREIQFHYFIQYHLDRQLRAAADYARSRGLVLKGDIPIGIYRYSVDAWVAPELYNMNGQSGAPPDPFSATGQNWGFPTYNWEVMAQNGYRWWQQRLRQLSRYFDTFRIDHILGFFRIWEIPLHSVEGLLGWFNKALPVRREEFAQRGIHFDRARLCEPYLPHHLIVETFGAETKFVIDTFLEGDITGSYRFKPELDTQRKVEAWFAENGTPELEPLRIPLYRLRSNVLILETDDPNEFHPRISLMDSVSFAELPQDQQWRLRELHDNYFYQRQEDFWRAQAMTKLPAIAEATDMLICGEDLGMVPDCVPGVMRELEFLTLEIQRMSKNPDTRFLQPEDVPYWSVVSPGTHDMSPLRLWWTELEPRERAQFYYEELRLHGEIPAELEPWMIKRILHQQIDFGGMWTIYPLQDLFAMNTELRHPDPEAERINVPANIPHYWRYRSHVSMEEMAKAEAFNAEVRGLSERLD